MAGKPILLALTSASLLGSCSYGYDIYARFDGRRIILDTHAKESRFAAGLCLDSLEVRSRGVVVWSIERFPPRDGLDCPNDFPIAYGLPPEGFRSGTPPVRLRPDTVYEVSGRGSASFEGSFRYSTHVLVRVENMPAG